MPYCGHSGCDHCGTAAVRKRGHAMRISNPTASMRAGQKRTITRLQKAGIICREDVTRTNTRTWWLELLDGSCAPAIIGDGSLSIRTTFPGVPGARDEHSTRLTFRVGKDAGYAYIFQAIKKSHENFAAYPAQALEARRLKLEAEMVQNIREHTNLEIRAIEIQRELGSLRRS